MVGHGADAPLLRLTTYLLGMAIIQFRASRRKAWLVAASVAGVFCVIFVGGDGTRRPLIDVVLYLVILVSFVQKIGYWRLARAAAVVLGVAILLSAVSPKMHSELGRDDFLSFATLEIVERITLGNGINNIHTIEFVRSGRLPLQNGAIHLRNFLGSIPGISAGMPLSYQLHLLLIPGSTATTYASGTYLMQIYADFGSGGVLFVYALIGCFAALMCRGICRAQKKATTLPFLAFCSMFAGNISISGFSGFLASFAVLLMIHSLINTVARFPRVSLSQSRESRRTPLSCRYCVDSSQKE
jgi:oligosaccharide repeat unit polymerase